ncbi:MAG: hypothetical protein QOJ07_2519 [Thermoleophilaceae bacterium]|nr:hypothetical protein [Thermoleophilaceae bacterium]
MSELEQAIADLLAQRAAGRTICPSEAARRVGGADWRDLMPAAREAAARLADRGRVVVTQKGSPVDARAARGPIRIGHPPAE